MVFYTILTLFLHTWKHRNSCGLFFLHKKVQLFCTKFFRVFLWKMCIFWSKWRNSSFFKKVKKREKWPFLTKNDVFFTFFEIVKMIKNHHFWRFWWKIMILMKNRDFHEKSWFYDFNHKSWFHQKWWFFDVKKGLVPFYDKIINFMTLLHENPTREILL